MADLEVGKKPTAPIDRKALALAALDRAIGSVRKELDELEPVSGDEGTGMARSVLATTLNHLESAKGLI